MCDLKNGKVKRTKNVRSMLYNTYLSYIEINKIKNITINDVKQELIKKDDMFLITVSYDKYHPETYKLHAV